MRLLIISHTRHVLHQGRSLGWGPTVEEVNWLARVFDHVVHLAYLHDEPFPNGSLASYNERVVFTPVPPSGGLEWQGKVRVITLAPCYLRAIFHWLPFADVVHVRAPCPIALYAMILLSCKREPLRWTKYAGNWGETSLFPPSFAFQRWWLRMGLSRGPVTVNGHWNSQPGHIFSLDNPCLSLEEVRHGCSLAMEKSFTSPLRLVFAGRLEKAKGIYTALQVMERLSKQVNAHLEIVGDGPERRPTMHFCERLGIGNQVTFHRWQPREQVKQILAHAHIVLLPSRSEGFPKVLSEAMCYGTVPLASNVSAIPQVLRETGAGLSISAEDVNGFVTAILEMVDKPDKWKQMSLAGTRAAQRFTYERYILALDEMFKTYYGSSPLRSDRVGEIREQFVREGELSSF